MANDVSWDAPLPGTPAERLVVLTPSLLRAADELLAALAQVERQAQLLQNMLTVATEE